jgi:hypothetical protein
MDYQWDQGADLIISLTYQEGPQGEEAPVDLSKGYAVRMDIAPISGNTIGTRVFSFNSLDFEGELDQPGPDDNEVTLGPAGEIVIKVPRSLTLPGGPVGDALPKQTKYVYDVFLRNTTSNTQKKILSGNITVVRSVTLWQ